MCDTGHTDDIDLILDALGDKDLDVLRALDERLEDAARERARRAEQRFGQTQLHEALHTISSLRSAGMSTPREVTIDKDDDEKPTIRVDFGGGSGAYPHDVTVEADGMVVFTRYQDQIRVFHEGDWMDQVVEAAAHDCARKERKELQESIQTSIERLQSIRLTSENGESDVQNLYRDIFGEPALRT